MIVGIDASNIRAGGGLTHLGELLQSAEPEEVGIRQVVVWGGQQILARLPNRQWLELVHQPDLDGTLFHRTRWKHTRLDMVAGSAKCDLLFAPGGNYTGVFRPFVTMSRNLLPFDHAERARFGWTPARFRYHVLEWQQSRTLRRASGVIFLTETAQREVQARTGRLPGRTIVVPHGLAERFVSPDRVIKPLSAYSPKQPFRWLYVSIVNQYKHQWHVADAAVRLRQEGWPITLDLVGPAYPPAARRLTRCLDRIDPDRSVVQYHGAISHAEIDKIYRQADAFVFASSCETFGQIVLEAMAMGLPLACSARSALPEVAGKAAVYFDPEDPTDIASVLRRLMEDEMLRSSLTFAAAERAKMYSWERCARETFKFLAEIARVGAKQ